ncbi:hypothetical protein scyTo_0020312, partial [Scyliorhinus torazame]|nr:hypothetical protein [Scyliorhinus torazame]
KLAWPDHKRECKCLRSIYPNVPTDMTRLVARIIFKLLTASPCSSEELYSVSDLQSSKYFCPLKEAASAVFDWLQVTTSTGDEGQGGTLVGFSLKRFEFGRLS